MDLDAWINEPEPDSEEESSDSSDTLSESLFPIVKQEKSNINSLNVITNGSSKKLKSNKEVTKTKVEMQLEIDEVLFIFCHLFFYFLE